MLEVDDIKPSLFPGASGILPGKKKGMRQGDPISSSLFVLVIYILSKDLDNAVRDGVFRAHSNCVDPLVAHLNFADDILVFFDGSSFSVPRILSTLRAFRNVSGLALSLRKSFLF